MKFNNKDVIIRTTMPEQLETTPQITPESVAEKRASVAEHLIGQPLGTLMDRVIERHEEQVDRHIPKGAVSAVIRAMHGIPDGGRRRVPSSGR